MVVLICRLWGTLKLGGVSRLREAAVATEMFYTDLLQPADSDNKFETATSPTQCNLSPPSLLSSPPSLYHITIIYIITIITNYCIILITMITNYHHHYDDSVISC